MNIVALYISTVKKSFDALKAQKLLILGPLIALLFLFGLLFFFLKVGAPLAPFVYSLI